MNPGESLKLSINHSLSLQTNNKLRVEDTKVTLMTLMALSL